MIEIFSIPLMAMGFVFLQAPYLAILPAGALMWLSLKTRRSIAMLAALSWALYGGYETMMWLRVWCTGECNIRIDLLLIYPLLLMLTAFSLLSAWAVVRRETPR